MPIYEYACETCDEHTELLQKLSDPPLAACPKCQGSVRKVISAPGLHFKGSGFYINDYAKKKGDQGSESKPAKKTESKSSTSSSKKKESTTASKKPKE